MAAFFAVIRKKSLKLLRRDEQPDPLAIEPLPEIKLRERDMVRCIDAMMICILGSPF